MWERKSMCLTGKQWTSRIIVTKNNSQTALTKILVSWRIWDKCWTCNRRFSRFNKDFRQFKLIATWNLTQLFILPSSWRENKYQSEVWNIFCEYSQRTHWCDVWWSLKWSLTFQVTFQKHYFISYSTSCCGSCPPESAIFPQVVYSVKYHW